MKPPGLVAQAPLEPCNTLRLPGKAAWLLRITDALGIPPALSWAESLELPVLVLGSGSNLVLAADYPGLVLQMAIAERTWQPAIASDPEKPPFEQTLLTLGAGENW
ncbi:MAG: UDP-N-acetylenolpyruvoylglucosamine reductase, partial [Halomonadaceae bacterium]